MPRFDGALATKSMPLRRRSNVRVWLKADLPRPEIEVRFAPNTGHSIADTTQNRQPHHAGSDERADKTRAEASPSIGGYSGAVHT